MGRLVVLLGVVLMAAVGLWLYTAKPKYTPSASSENTDVAGIKAEQNIPSEKLRRQKRSKPVSRFAADPSAFLNPVKYWYQVVIRILLRRQKCMDFVSLKKPNFNP